MKRVIRPGLFETNSSSVHSYIECSKEEYERLENFTAYLYISGGDLRDDWLKVKFINIQEYPKDKYQEVEDGYQGNNWDALTEEEKKLWVNIYNQNNSDFYGAYTFDLISDLGLNIETYEGEKVEIGINGYY